MRQPRTIGAAMGIVASLALAGTALGATWAPPVELSTSDDSRDADVVTIDSQHALAAYTETDDLFTRLTANGGASWGSPLPITSNGEFPALAANGSDVDLVWNSSNGRVHYAHSPNGGASFGSSMTVSPSGRFNWVPAIGRGPGGLVAVAYVDAGNNDVAVRVSTNGGTSFQPRVVIEPDGEEQSVAVAVGDGVIYVAYAPQFQQLRVRRSTDAGAHWSTPSVISNNLFDTDFSLAAAGDQAYVAFSQEAGQATFSQVRYRRTMNSGATWSSSMALADPTWSTLEPDVALAGGVLRAAFIRCTADFDICIDNRAYYRQSSNGTTWGKAQRVSPKSLFDAFSARVGAHRPLVTYIGDDDSGIRAFARTKS